MKNRNEITIESFDELIQKMKSMEFWVEWTVFSEIGPNWIGSIREIDFYLDNFVLSATKFNIQLKDKLIKVFSIPEKSKDHVIKGHGNITLKGDGLEIHYDWEATIPYDEPDSYEEGRMMFFTRK